MRNEAIEERLDRILQRLTPPRSVAKSPHLQGEEIRAMHKAIISAAPTKGYEAWMDDFEERLFSSLKTRAWPTLNEVKSACYAKKSGGGVVSDEQKVEMAVQWFDATRRPHPTFNSPEITQEIISRGLVADLREARWRGFDMTPKQSAAARDMRPSREEWSHHVEVMARINNMSIADAEIRERREMSPGQLPAHLEPIK